MKYSFTIAAAFNPYFTWIIVVFGEVVDVDSSGPGGDLIQDTLEGVVQLVVLPHSALVGSINDDLLDARPLLVVEQPNIVGEPSDLGQDVIRDGEPVANGNAPQSSEEASLLRLLDNLGCDGWDVFACVALSEDEKVAVAGDAQTREAPVGIDIEFMEGVVEIGGNLCVRRTNTGHVVDVRVSHGGVGIGQTRPDGLVHEQDIVLSHPGPVVPHDLVGLGIVGDEPEGTQLHEVAELAGRAGASVEPDQGRIFLHVGETDILLPVEDERQSGGSPAGAEVPALDGSCVSLGVPL